MPLLTAKVHIRNDDLFTNAGQHRWVLEQLTVVISPGYCRQELQCIRHQRVVLGLNARLDQQPPDIGDKLRHISIELFIVFLRIQTQIVADLRTQRFQNARFFVLLNLIGRKIAERLFSKLSEKVNVRRFAGMRHL